MRDRTTSCLLALAILHVILASATVVSGQDVADEEQGAGLHLVTTTRKPAAENSTATGEQETRKDLNELPEMKKAKELKAEGEKAEIEAASMRELARLEEELKRRGEEEHAEQQQHQVGSNTSMSSVMEEEKTANGQQQQQQKEESEEGEETEEAEAEAPHLSSSSASAANDEHRHSVDAAVEPSKEEEEHHHQPNESSPPLKFETVAVEEHKEDAKPEGVEEVEGHHPVESEGTQSPLHQQQQEEEALVTTQRTPSPSSHQQQQPAEEGEEESAGAEDPFFQTSTTASPSNPPPSATAKAGEGGEEETEIVHEVMHVHSANGGGEQKPEEQAGKHGQEEEEKKNADGGGGMEEQKSEDGEEKIPSGLFGMGQQHESGGGSSAPPPIHQQTETLISAAGHEGEPQGQGGEEAVHEHPQQHGSEQQQPAGGEVPSKETAAEEEEETTLAEILPTAAIESSTGAAKPLESSGQNAKTEEAEEKMAPPPPAEDDSKGEEQHRTEAEDDHSAPIVFPANQPTVEPPMEKSTSNGQATAMATTEESAVIAGDKSVFESEENLPEPGQAHIQHMSHEGEPKEKPKEAEEEEKQPAAAAGDGEGLSPVHQPEQATQSTTRGGPAAMVPVNEGSDGFELITKEELGDAPAATTEETPEILPTPAEEPTAAVPIVGAGEAEDKMRAQQSQQQQQQSTGATPAESAMGEEHAGGMDMMEGEGMEKHGMPAADTSTTATGTMEAAKATTAVGIMGGMGMEQDGQQQQQQSTADTPPQRGDLPGLMETSHPMEEPQQETTTTSTMAVAPAVQSTTEFANEVDRQEETTMIAADLLPTTSMSPEQMELAKSRAFRTPFSIRLPDIEWRLEFEDLNGGPANKLREQLADELKAALQAALGPANSLLDFELTALRPGSVIVDGLMLTREEVVDPQAVVQALEQAILAKGGQLGGNPVDTNQLSVAGSMPTGASSNDIMAGQLQKQQQQETATNTGLIIGGAVVVGVLIVVFAIFAIVVFGLNSRRNNCGSLKLSGKEEICMAENGGKPPRRLLANGLAGAGDAEQGNGGVNLMSLRSVPNTPTTQPQHQMNGGNGRSGGGERPILVSGSQFSSPNNYQGHGPTRQ